MASLGLKALLLLFVAATASCVHGRGAATDPRSGGAGEAEAREGAYVFSRIASVEELEQDAQLRGKLAPPDPAGLPAGLAPRAPGSVRVVTMNIHMAVPGDRKLDPANENIDALRDVARFINSLDADVVFVQEMRNRPRIDGLPGLSEAASVFARLVKADSMAFTPAIEKDPLRDNLKHYGTAIYTRNGYTLERVVNVALPNAGPEIEPRSAGVAAVRPPAGEPFAVISTHLAHRVVEDQPLRDLQLAALAKLVGELNGNGSFAFLEAIGGREQVARGFPRGRVVLGGDLNQKQPPSDLVLRQAGLIHVSDLLEARGPANAHRAVAAKAETATAPGGQMHRIDHLYAAGLEIVDAAVGEVPSHEFAGPATDHRAVIADFALTR